jgi:DNA-binding Lrp family transcriptional regulator
MKLREYVQHRKAWSMTPKAKSDCRRLLEAIRADPSLSIPQIAEKTGLTQNEVSNRVKHLRESGRIRYVLIRRWEIAN